MKLGGSLARRGNEPLGDYCPMDRALRALRTRSAVLVLREAFYGATKFEEFTARADLTDSTTSAHLRDLVRAGILEKRPYQEPGQRQRHEYVLTPAGADLMPVLLALLQWSNRHDPPPYPPELHHDGCGSTVTVEARCEKGHVVGADELVVTAAGPFGIDRPATAS
jgi:DNA-binding HxlR family transcriptional regulator